MKTALPAVSQRPFLFQLTEALEDARAKFLEGDRLSLAEAILLCDDVGLSPSARPLWIRENADQIPKSHLSHPHKIRNPGTGRHTNPFVKTRENLVHLWTYQAVKEATDCGSTGDGRWAHASDLLKKKRGIHRSAGSVKRSFYLIKSSLNAGGKVSKFLLPRHPRITKAYHRKWN